MSISGPSPAASIGGREPHTDKTHVVSMHRQILTNKVSSRTLPSSTEPVVTNLYMLFDFLVGMPS